MTDKLLCPFCNKPLQPTHRIEDEYFCENYDCPQTSLTWVGTSSLWKALADTKKKLDIAVKALNKIANTDIKVIEKEPLYYARAMFSVTNNALGRIQDIEQKDVK